ncbi:MAG: septum formation protein Maf [Saprospiraceae bacterium]|nr:septum formation protein Maf [Saprospiraceae bacterium]
MMDLNRYKIILASQSPRRQQLLREAGFENFVVRPMNVDETPPPQYPTEKLGEFLAEKKAEAARSLLGVDGDLILASDTTVVLNGKLYEKPFDEADAQRILRELSGEMHQVITGVCLLSAHKKVIFSDISNVYFDDLTAFEIDFYIKKYQPFDKAGAYGVQEWLGHCKIKRIEGSYENIMGLPTFKIYQALMGF